MASLLVAALGHPAPAQAAEAQVDAEPTAGSESEVLALLAPPDVFEPSDLDLPAARTTATGAIAGTVVADAGGVPLSGICVDVNTLSGPLVARGTTAANGTYTVGGLATGTYNVEFNGCGNPSYAVEYYNNKPGLSLGNPVPVTDGATTSGINAGLAAGGSIAGTVTADGTGSPLLDMCPSAFLSSGEFVAGTRTNASGQYTIAGLAVGSFKVRISDCVGSVDYAAEYYDNVQDLQSAALVSVVAGATTSGINAGLGLGGRISGTVTADGTGAALAGICASGVIPATGSSSHRATTAADGTYTIAGLAQGSYQVRFQDCVGPVDYATEFYDNKPDRSSAASVAVTGGATTSGVNAGLSIAGRISGTVTADGTGAPLSGICVTAYVSNATNVFDTGSTAADGTYTIVGLAPASYKVRFQDCVGAVDYAIEYYDNKLNFQTATAVPVSAGAVTSGINAGLAAGGRISGTVTADGTGAPLAGICVSAFHTSTNTSLVRPVTSADGTYLVLGLAAGSYKVRFQDCVGSVEYATEHYNNKPDFAAADIVPVSVGATTSGINAALGIAGSISGTVVADGTGTPLAGICVNPLGSSNSNPGSSGTTGADGAYMITGLAAGSYKIHFQDCVGSIDYAIEYYDNKFDFNSANAVPVSAGAVTSGINAGLAVAGRISGTVVADGTGAPLAGICVTAHPTSTGTSLIRATTAADGTYLATGLTAGGHKVRFQDDCFGPPAYVTEYYDNKPDYATANIVSVSAGATTAGINAGLAARRPAKHPADFDGDGDTDRSVYRGGAWYAEGQGVSFLGTASDIPVPGDYDNNGSADKAVYRDGVWYTLGQDTAFLGLAGDVPVPGDYNGDGRTERAVFRPSVGAWYVEGQPAVYFGASGDIPVPGDYDGNGTTDVAVFRPSVGGWYVNGQATVFTGLSTDIPVPGDYDGDGTTDKAVFRPSVGGWYVFGQNTVFTGLSGDIPVPGDYNASGTTDRAVWRKSVGGWYVDGQGTAFFGLSGDVPLPLPQAIYRVFFTP